ncbi:hypothetical protein [Algoriphagus sp. NG3]|uniref:hypothetical protein n=1 Tax=Algoriphagus sp. NG3 TaxID=3097546 RepID=UPI002A7F2AAF|nr:hypothetical protein [Algoriphagus sp. NG3]WPR77740.1 hypothetical protein SLW71_10330 [Algoriphagus sp. NG3]
MIFLKEGLAFAYLVCAGIPMAIAREKEKSIVAKIMVKHREMKIFRIVVTERIGM